MPIQDYYEFPTAYNPDTEQLQADAVFQVFALTDLAQANPLQVLTVDTGSTLPQLRSNSIGMLPSFRVAGDPTQVIIKSGSFTTLLSSKYGIVWEAGLDPQTVADAIAARTVAEAAAGAANVAAGAAAVAEADAEEAAALALATAAAMEELLEGFEPGTGGGGGGGFAFIEDPDDPGFFVVVPVAPEEEAPVPPTITTPSLNAMTQGVPFTQTLTAVSGTPVTWAVSVGSLPAGLTWNGTTGVISGTPSGSGAYSVTFTATNVAGVVSRQFTGTITASGTAPVVSAAGLNALTQGVPFTQTLTAAGSTPITWAVTAGALPAGLALSAAGVLSGTPTGSGAFSFTVRATNSFGNGTRQFTGTVTAASTGGGVGTRVASYGPNGTHWPTNTPLPDATFAYSVEVDPTLTAIEAAINAAPVSGNARVLVRPGALPPGLGAQSGDQFSLTAGVAGRTSKVLVLPRDGYGTVTGSPSSTLASKDSNGYKLGLENVAMMGFDFSGQGLNLCDSLNTAIGWSTIGYLTVIARQRNATNLELVEVVMPGQVNYEEDRMSARVANNYSIGGLTFAGVYAGPAYKAAGSSAHCDTFQTSSTGTGGFDDLVFEDSIFMQGSSQTLQLATLDTVRFRHAAFIGGLRATGRYPIVSGRHVMVAENTLWGFAQDAYATEGTVVMGSINSAIAWTQVTDSTRAFPSGSAPASGTWATNPAWESQSTPQTAWLDANSPEPTPAFLASIWGALG